ncbi:MAG: lysine transporter LysE [Firmicutes bacterium HGW-Firmicutes-1]|jgi:threonine/homoserine/homoserine lactone efflux protein|nr:MAG: lysine transporter LysE [Firmicutes bacterium HGW-Firmicutes-1]
MNYLMIGATSFAIGFSGALMPGPLLGLTIDVGIKKGAKGGLLLGLGHALLELVTVVLLMLGLKEFFTYPIVSGVIGIVGGLVLLLMGLDMFFSAIKNKISLEDLKTAEHKYSWKKLIIKGVTVSISNPYFILWWASIGMALLVDSLKVGLVGVALVYIGHILSDISWFTFVAFSMSKSRKLMSPKVYKGLIIGLGAFVVCFALYFINSGIQFIW